MTKLPRRWQEWLVAEQLDSQCQKVRLRQRRSVDRRCHPQYSHGAGCWPLPPASDGVQPGPRFRVTRRPMCLLARRPQAPPRQNLNPPPASLSAVGVSMRQYRADRERATSASFPFPYPGQKCLWVRTSGEVDQLCAQVLRGRVSTERGASGQLIPGLVRDVAGIVIAVTSSLCCIQQHNAASRHRPSLPRSSVVVQGVLAVLRYLEG